MNPILAAGLLIGVLCGVWTFVMGFTGWYKDPAMASAFFAVILIEIGGLIWGLKKTAAQGRTYSGQVVAGTLMSIIAGVVIVGSSLLFTVVFFPDYFAELEAVYRDMLRQQGKTEAEIASEVATWSSGQTPMQQAMNGFIGTFVTGVVVSAVIAIWVRARPAAPQATESRV
ncbi:MAG: DUF4199 domain-containing protein [Vicinamibacterales bacterium]